MNKKITRILRTNITLYSLCLVAFALAAIPVSPVLAAAEGVVAVLIWLVSRRNSRAAQQNVRQYMERLNGGMDSARSSNMLYAPLGMMVFDLNRGDVLWANDRFLLLTQQENSLFESQVEQVVPGFDTRWLVEGKGESPALVEWNGRKYRVFGSLGHSDEITGTKGSTLATTYWMDVTETEEMRAKIRDTQPVAAVLMLDNYEELMKACPESKRSAVLAALEEKIGAWTAGTDGMLLKFDRDRYLFLFEERSFDAYAEHRFDLLDSAREVVADEGVAATLSIGVGRDADTLDGLLKNAFLALEMALSRGGDQAVVKDRANFSFYGGRAKVTEKRTKVKSRVMAGALGDLMDEAGQVYVMGHKYADMDSLGAAVGIVAIARKRGKKAQIVMDVENNAVHPALKALQALPEYANVFISGGEAFLRAHADTLLVVVDTNRPGSVESEQLLDACTRVAVIDHHRRGTSYIDKMTLNYHEPYASSTSELVTELLGYLVETTDILRPEAEALLAGIVLDTKNFTNRTGGRTFEAAAYLRRLGADTSDVQRMFQSDLEDMISRYDIIRQAQLYRDDLAIAVLQEECDRVTAAKASDELLTIKGVCASFVLYPKGESVYISARSLGDVNVQVIVEELGGGGNSTTAGGYLHYSDVEEAKAQLLQSIDKYFEN